MSIGAPSYSPLNRFEGTAPDSYSEVVCPGATRLTLQVANQGVYLLFGHGRAGAVQYEQTPELYLPVTGSIARPFDAFKVRAQTPAAQLPAGQVQAYAILTPRQ